MNGLAPSKDWLSQHLSSPDTELRAVQVSMAPPKRLMQDGRFRTLKVRDDRTLWDGLTEPLHALVDDGWEVVRVVIDWGRSQPLVQRERERHARLLLQCGYDTCAYQERMSGQGRGLTDVTLSRRPAEPDLESDHD